MTSMAFWKRKQNWEDEYDEYYAQDRRLERTRKPGRLRVLPHLLLLGFVGSLFVGGVGLVSGPTMVEKLLTAMATPVGVVWIILMVLVYFCLLSRQAWPAIAGFICWLILTIGGNQFVAVWLIGTLEAPYRDINIFDLEPLETVLVLGGGTSSTIHGQAQLGFNGDRVAVAARLYHAGLVKQLICSGTQTFRHSPKDLHMRDEAAEILIGLGVPKEVIMRMEGENTSREIANLKTWLEKSGATGRVGIISSAWHLPRVMRLAQEDELEVYPIPANFLSMPPAPSPSMVVPSAVNLMVTAQACREYLARVVGR
jgi:uncharacterized SAM-binding protein YcdF (DUF218 family)